MWREKGKRVSDARTHTSCDHKLCTAPVPAALPRAFVVRSTLQDVKDDAGEYPANRAAHVLAGEYAGGAEGAIDFQPRGVGAEVGVQR